MNVYAIGIGFALGIFIASLMQPSLYILLYVAVPSLLLLGAGIHKAKKHLLLAGIFILGISLGGVRVLPELMPPNTLDHLIGKEITVSGVVVEEVDIRETHTRFVMRTDSTRVLVSTDKYTDVTFGDTVEVIGKLEKPKPFETENGRVFAYDMYLAKDDVHYSISFADVALLAQQTVSPRGILFSIKQFFLTNIGRALPEPMAALGGGITVGAKRSLGEYLLEAFQITGLIHIVVLSGYNVTIIAEAIMRFLSFAPKRIALSAGVVSIGLFVLMVGAGATIVRAGIMAILALIARATGRVYVLTRALLLAGVGMLIINPLILVYDPSFQLSFIATLGLIYVAPIIEKYLSWVPTTLGLREIVSATIGTQIAVFPLLIHITGLFSISSLPANVLVLPIIPFAMLATLIAGIAGAIPELGILLGIPAYISLSYILLVVEVLAKIPGAAITLPTFPFWVVALLYAALGIFVWRFIARNGLQQRSSS